MAILGQKKNKKKSHPQTFKEDLDSLKSDVASFASSLGLAAHSSDHSAAAFVGFDDSDFRKSGPIKPSKPSSTFASGRVGGAAGKKSKKKESDAKPAPKPHPLEQFKHFAAKNAPDIKKSSLPKLPLMKASALSGLWHVDADELEVKVLGPDGRKKVASLGIEEQKRLVEAKKEVALRLLEQYTAEYESSRRKYGDMKLLEATTRSGTSADKVSAFTCLVEDNPIANIRSLDALLSMVTSKVGKRYAFTGFEALRELFLSRLLPDRKLKFLFQHPLDNLPETKDGFSLLLFWYWEECLKQRYERFIVALEEALKDMLPNLKDKAMKTVFILLKSKSEQERRLLTALVNKLGDPVSKAASGAMYHLTCLLSAHPNMKAVVIDEVDTFIFRPNIGMRAKYQAVNFLSQILLSKKGDGPKVAKRLIDVYFALFKVLILETKSDSIKYDKKGGVNGREKGKVEKIKAQGSKTKSSSETNIEMDSRLLSALLTGVNRAFPFVSSDEADHIVEVQTPTLFRLVHSRNFNVGIQSLMLLYQISSRNQIVSERFYRALYAKLLTPAAVSSSKPELFLGLLVKSMKNDLNLKRVSAFSKRLLQVALQRPPQYACGCLFILSEVLKAKPPLWSVVLQKESVDDDVEHFVDIIDDPEDLCISPSRNLSNTRSLITSRDGKKQVYEWDSDSECKEGSKDWSNYQNASNDNLKYDRTPPTGIMLPAGYNPRHREPLYCNADRACWWELTVLASHVHPSVATMARTLLSGANIVYNGDPLNDLSLSAFIDKLMEKKPKANRIAEGSWYGGSQIAPARKMDLNNHLIGNEILQLAEDEVPPEDVVFHRFYMNKSGLSKKAKKKKKKASVSDEDAEDLLMDVNDESEDEEIDNMLGSGQRPFEEPEGEYDYDDLDRIADEDDDDLIGNGSDADTGLPADPVMSKHGRNTGNDDDDEDDEDDDENYLDIGISGDGSSDSDDEANQLNKGKKRKFDGRPRASPFASLKDYEHLMGDESDRKTFRSHKKKKLSS